jgi:hypothetical protein
MAYLIAIGVPEPSGACFVAIPFSSQFQDVRRDIDQAATNANLQPTTLGRVDQGPSFIDAIHDQIRSARVLVAVLTPEADTQAPNPNVLYELGLASAVGKPTLILTADLAGLPANLRDRDIVEYKEQAAQRVSVGGSPLATEVELRLRQILARMGARRLTDPAYPWCHEEAGRRSASPSGSWSNLLVVILSFAKRAHHGFQSFDSGHVDILLAAIDRISRIRAVDVETARDFDRLLRTALMAYDAFLERALLHELQLRAELDNVEDCYRKLLQGASEGVRTTLARSEKSFQGLRTKMVEYPSLVNGLRDFPLDIEESLKAGNAEMIYKPVLALSKKTKSIVVDADNLLLDLLDVLV